MAKPKPLRVGKVSIDGKRPVFILGPCVIESEKFVRRMAKKIAEACASENVDSFSKLRTTRQTVLLSDRFAALACVKGAIF
jgi:3-deoxy-D-manno-octulosonic acid (KDO) 8-phosphate synthase